MSFSHSQWRQREGAVVRVAEDLYWLIFSNLSCDLWAQSKFKSHSLPKGVDVLSDGYLFAIAPRKRMINSQPPVFPLLKQERLKISLFSPGGCRRTTGNSNETFTLPSVGVQLLPGKAFSLSVYLSLFCCHRPMKTASCLQIPQLCIRHQYTLHPKSKGCILKSSVNPIDAQPPTLKRRRTTYSFPPLFFGRLDRWGL